MSRGGRFQHPDLMGSHIMDNSVLMSAEERRMYLENTMRNDSRLLTNTVDLLSESELMLETTIDPVKQRTNNAQKIEALNLLFLDVVKARKTLDFDAIQDLIQICSKTLEDIQYTARPTANTIPASAAWLQTERDMWRLISSLYRDRLQKDGMECDDLDLMRSEKTIVEYLYLNNSVLREYQLIVDWLELCASEQMSAQVGQFTDRTVAWENTLHQFQNPQKNVFNTNRNLVQSIDPDAPTREKRSLHDLDTEDQKRLMRAVFTKIRQGKIEEAQSLCEHCGQSWQAAILEGWRLSNDPNYYEPNQGAGEKMHLEGNPHRDIWKRCAWMKADSSKLDEYTRAIPAIFCGHLDALTAVCGTWMDQLWAYFKVQIDIRVEFEIRQCSARNYYPMPDQYWNHKMSLEQIFDALAASKNELIRLEAHNKMNNIVRFIILDDIDGLMRTISQWLSEEVLQPHILRFLAHFVLFLRQIERVQREEVGDRVLRAYVEHLIQSRDPRLVAFYTVALPKDTQVVIFSQLLDVLRDTNERQVCLAEALSAGLDIDRITQYTVQMVREREELGQRPREQKGDLTQLDQVKIGALEYLQFYPRHRGELLYQANALVRQFLATENLEGVRKALQSVPPDSVRIISDIFGALSEMPYREECAIKENICHNAYLAAVDAFNQWTHAFHNRPRAPQKEKQQLTFTEKTAFELKEQEHQAELQRWTDEVLELKRAATGLLYNVLLFPDHGWLVDPDSEGKDFDKDTEEWQNRLIQLNSLRSIAIPEIVILLHKCLHLSEDYQECVRLADELASENRKLYKCYPAHKLSELLVIMAESSLALLTDKCDPWGYAAI